MQATSLRLPDDLGNRLNLLAKETGRTKTFYIIEAIKTHIEDLEDIYIAEQRLADIRAGRSKLYSIEEVEAELGLDTED